MNKTKISAKKFRFFAFQAIIIYIIVEVLCSVAIYTKYIPANLPSFSSDLFKDVIVADVNEHWGNWHPYREAVLKRGDCIDMVMKYNSIGARDKERSELGDSNRVVFLGDSYIEGYGVKEEARLSNLLEKETGREMLNFGCSGLGFVQEYLVYEHLAKKYSHNTVLLGLMPGNDFVDSDLAQQKEANMGHYKPYFTGNYPDCTLTHWVEKLEDSPYAASKIKGWKRKTVRIFKSFTFWFNIFYYFQYLKPEIDANNAQYSGFYDFTPTQLESLKCSLQALKNSAKNKYLIVFSIPNEIDFQYYKAKGESPLQRELTTFCEEIGIKYIDLLSLWYKEKQEKVKDLYIPCDGHWAEKANVKAAKTLLPLFQK
ncbi:MAG: hypothetical protein ACKVTZ_08730 [Bacteroidia bacterium]